MKDVKKGWIKAIILHLFTSHWTVISSWSSMSQSEQEEAAIIVYDRLKELLISSSDNITEEFLFYRQEYQDEAKWLVVEKLLLALREPLDPSQKMAVIIQFFHDLTPRNSITWKGRIKQIIQALLPFALLKVMLKRRGWEVRIEKQ